MLKQLLYLLIAIFVSLSSAGQKLPPFSRIIYFGDSQTSFSYNSSGNTVQFQNFGYVPWVMAMCPSVTMPKGGILAIPGETTSQMVNRLSAITGFGARIMVVLGGTNDPLFPNLDSATTTRNLRRIYDAGITAGMRIIAVTILPRFAQNIYSPEVERRRLWINDWIRSQTDVTVVDAEQALNGAHYFEDGLHTSPAGAFALGKIVSDKVNGMVEACLPGSASAAQLTVAPNSNPLMAGSGGRTNMASGTVATNWQLAGNFAGTASVVGSKETGEDGDEKQVITLSGTYTGNTRRVTFNNYAGMPIALSAGQVVEGVAEIEIPAALTGIKAVYLRIQAYAPEYASTLADGNSMFPTSNRPFVMQPGRYVLRTPPVTLDPGTVGQLTTQIVIEFNSTTTTDPVSMVMKVSSIGIRQLPLSEGPLATITPAGTQQLCTGQTLSLQAGAGNDYHYRWLFDGKPVADSVNASFAAGAPGAYTLKVSTPGCSVLSPPTVLTADGCTVEAVFTDSVATSLCTGQSTEVPFRVTGSFGAENIFTAQLSDANGSFDAPLAIGNLPATSGGSIPVVIPAGLPVGTGYRVRVISSVPALTGSITDSPITIHAKPIVTISPADTVTYFSDEPVVLRASSVPVAGSFQWLLNDTALAANGSADSLEAAVNGRYLAVAVTEAGCTDTSAVTIVQYRIRPGIETDSLATGVCAGEPIHLPFRITGTFSHENIFSFQLSDRTGSFDSPVLLATKTDTAGGAVTGIIPVATPGGAGYRLRVSSSSPAALAETPLVVYGKPAASIFPADSATSEAGQPAALRAQPEGAFGYQWLRNNTPIADSANGVNYLATQEGHYRVVVSSAEGCSDTSAVTVVTLTPAAVVLVPELVMDSLPSSLCTGKTFPVSFQKTGRFGEENRFRLQLSDASGSFAQPVIIGEKTDTTGGSILATIPASAGRGSGYRIRVASSHPAVISSDNGQNITINLTPEASIDPPDSVLTFPAIPVTLTAFPQGTSLYQWLHNGQPAPDDGTELTYTTSAEGAYRVVVTSDEGCVDTSAVTIVRFRECPAIDVSVVQADSLVTVSASGGIGSYRYSINGGPYQVTNRFYLSPGDDYVVTVKDSVGCTADQAFSLRVLDSFSPHDGSGSRNTTLAAQSLGRNPGKAVVLYDMLNRPDQMDIYCDSRLAASTGGLASGKGWLVFDYVPPEPAGPYTCNIRISAPRDGGEWTYKTLPPLPSFRAMRQGTDTASDAVFVSPNFPDAYPAHISLVQTFSPAQTGQKLRADFSALLLNAGTLFVYDGADTTAPLLGEFSGLYGIQNHPSVVAGNAAGQLTFRFVNTDTAGKFGWVARITSQSTIRSFAPALAGTGDTVIIYGNGFYQVEAVRFGGVAAAAFEVLSDTAIRAIVAAGASGRVEVTMAGRPLQADGFTYYAGLQPCPGTTQVLTASGTGSTYQWQMSTDSVSFTDLADSEVFAGANNADLQIQNIPSAFYGYRFRCLVDGLAGDVFALRFVNTWTGSTDTAWETPSNWSCGRLPDEHMEVVIPANAVVEVNAETTIRSLRIKEGATVTIKPGVMLRVKR